MSHFVMNKTASRGRILRLVGLAIASSIAINPGFVSGNSPKSAAAAGVHLAATRRNPGTGFPCRQAKIACRATIGSDISTKRGEPLPQTPAFDYFSVKELEFAGGRANQISVVVEPKRLEASVVNMHTLVAQAFGVQDFQIQDEPRWFRTGYFQVEGLVDGPVDRATMMAMLRTALSDRFKLQAVRETKAFPIFNMVVAPGGLKAAPLSKDGLNRSPGQYGQVKIGAAVTIPGFITFLNRDPDLIGHPVFDKTGLAGDQRYDLGITLDLPLDELPVDPARPPKMPPMPQGQELADLIEKQLGLQLIPALESFDSVTIQHAEFPDVNQ